MTTTTTPTPLAICLEDLDAPKDDERYLRCVALPGEQPGLTLDRQGGVKWMPDGPEAYEIWVSLDGRLVIYRNDGAPQITVRRGGRTLEAPAEKPVLLLDQDLLEVAGRRLRVHVHGEADEVHEPEFLSARSLARMARAAAAALALGTAVGGAGVAEGAPVASATGDQAIEVRLHPPKKKVPLRKTIRCDILKLGANKKGGSTITMTCPDGVDVKWTTGYVVHPKTGAYVKFGQVTVKKVKGKTVVGTTPLKKLDGAKQVVFRLSDKL